MSSGGRPLRPGPAGRRARRRRVISVLGAVVLLVPLLAGCGTTKPKPATTMSAFLAAWSQHDWAAMAALVDNPPSNFAAVNQTAWSTLGVESAVFTPGPVIQQGTGATATLDSRLTLTRGTPLTLHSTLTLTEVKGAWRVTWSPTTIAD